VTITERFALPETLPASVDELNVLLTTALAQINLIQARANAGETLSREDVDYLKTLIESRKTLRAEIASVTAADEAHRTELASLLEQAADAAEPEATETAEPTAEPDTGSEPLDSPGEVAASVEQNETEVLEITPDMIETPAERTQRQVGGGGGGTLTPIPAGSQASASDGNRPVNFSGLDTQDAPTTPKGPGWRMKPNAPGYTPDPVGFGHIGRALDGQIKGSRKARALGAQERGSFMAQMIADLRRPNVPVISDAHELVAEIDRVTTTTLTGRDSTDRVPVTAQALVAAGGWCSPSEVLYDFCDVPDATDLISIPEITIVRGGVRWPVEPDLTQIFENFEFFFTEPELEAVDSNNFPQAVKECVQIPCPDEFEEMRLNVVGYCVEAGILQTQGWPELITWFTQSLVAEHLRAISRRTILDMVQGSTLEVFSSAYLIGTIGAVLNSISLMATNLRLNRGLSRTAPIEAVAPSWLFEAMRSDAVYYGDMYAPALSDAQIQGWFAERNISIQLVGDWQTRDVGQPGALGTTVWPAYVDIMLYPAGTWFRAMQNVIELGVMYPKEELVLNRYTRMFTEDAIAVGSRCYPSQIVRIPITINGGIGNRYTVNPPSITVDAGIPLTGAPITGGPSDFTQGNVYSLTVNGAPTGGSFVLNLLATGASGFSGQQTVTIAYNATWEQVEEAFEGIYGLTADDIFVSSSTAGETQGGTLPTDVLDITVPYGFQLSVNSYAGLIGGTSPNAVIALVSTGTGT
jgi:hypothetical protein